MNLLDVIIAFIKANWRLIVAGTGLFIAIEAMANLWYWRDDKHPWYFQWGRLLCVIFGVLLIVVSVVVA